MFTVLCCTAQNSTSSTHCNLICNSWKHGTHNFVSKFISDSRPEIHFTLIYPSSLPLLFSLRWLDHHPEGSKSSVDESTTKIIQWETQEIHTNPIAVYCVGIRTKLSISPLSSSSSSSIDRKCTMATSYVCHFSYHVPICLIAYAASGWRCLTILNILIVL